MAETYPPSPQGLTPCPTCKRHFFVGPDDREPVCSFCGATAFTPPAPRPQRARRLAAGLLAASLAGCPAPVPVYGGPPPPPMNDAMANAPAYGGPPPSEDASANGSEPAADTGAGAAEAADGDTASE